MLIKAPHWNTRAFQEIGRGGEAVIYKIKDDTVAKIFLAPDDPQYASDATQQKAAAKRIEEMQKKLYDIPGNLPDNVVTPTGLLVDAQEKIFGYTMPLVQDSKNLSELKRGAKRTAQVKKVLLQLYDSLALLHKENVVVGDLNDNNILVDSKHKIRLIDVDSMQFNKYTCPSFIPKFTPPEFLSVTKASIKLKKKRTPLADWYGFLVIAMRLIVNTDPYGGVVNMTLGQRIKEHITVFDPRVTYPAVAVPWKSLPRPLLEMFFEAFVNRERFIPDRVIFESCVNETKRRTKSA